MLSFLKRKPYPIGIDLGSDCVRMVQLAGKDDGLELLAAAKTQIPLKVRRDPMARQAFLAEAIKTMFAKRGFKGRQANIALPSRDMLIEHLRVPMMDQNRIEEALLSKVQQKLSFDVRRALVRHLVVADVYHGADAQKEVIMMVAAQNIVEYYLGVLERARLEIDAVNVEPFALIGGFAHLLEAQEDQDQATMLLDLGHGSTKVLVAHGKQLVFARTIPVGADAFVRCVQKPLGMSYEQAMPVCRRIAAAIGDDSSAQPTPAERQRCAAAQVPHDTIAAATATAVAETTEALEPQTKAAAALKPLLHDLGEDIRSCIRYHDIIFENKPVSRIVFLGGQAKNTAFCRLLAQGLGLRAQLGDPIARIIANTADLRPSDLDAEARNCDWALAFGLSMARVAS